MDILCRDLHTGTSQIIYYNALYRRAYRRVSDNSAQWHFKDVLTSISQKPPMDFSWFYQPVHIALQNPCGS
ncbi:MAG: hypothetical protein ABR597_14875, partial [Bacteroidales bacterium]